MSLDSHHEGGWSSIIDMPEGTYGVKTSAFDVFINPGAKHEPEALKEEASTEPQEKNDEDVPEERRNTITSLDLEELFLFTKVT